MVTVKRVNGMRRLACVDKQAIEAGLFSGMPLVDARALVSHLNVFAADLVSDRRTLLKIANWCNRYTPLVSVRSEIWLDISGCAHLFGGEMGLLCDLKERLRTFGYENQAAVADTPGAAWAIARFGKCGNVPSNCQKKVLAPLPLAALRLDCPSISSLNSVGIHIVGDLYDIPRALITPRFGKKVLERLDQALGYVSEPLSFNCLTTDFRAQATFAEIIGTRENISQIFENLLKELFNRLEKARLGTCKLKLSCYRTDGKTCRIMIVTKQPSRDIKHIKYLFKEKLLNADVDFCFDAMTLDAVATRRLTVKQWSFCESNTPGNNFALFIDRLISRLGRSAVTGLKCHQSHIPERAFQKKLPVRYTSNISCLNFSRPLHLLPFPEQIKVTVSTSNYSPIVFRWRSDNYYIEKFDGPERIYPEWWVNSHSLLSEYHSCIRDYYYAEVKKGYRFWIFHECANHFTKKSSWFLHGFFA